jgi:cell division protease FtsH
LQDALYVEKITRLLPTYSISSRTNDDVVLGYWLTGGASIPATAFRRLRQNMSWIGAKHLKDVVQAAGFEVAEVMPLERSPDPAGKAEKSLADVAVETSKPAAPDPNRIFELAGRPELANFFNEHIVDIILHRDRYKALGIDFPSAVILHGPPGCGKTFAVEKLVEYLGWPSFQIDASSVASPYIHETSKKVAQVFEKAMDGAPSVLVIDEMEAFLADRDIGARVFPSPRGRGGGVPSTYSGSCKERSSNHRNDESHRDLIDPAIQRRGRFDHVIKVDFASEVEVQSLLDKLLSNCPKSPTWIRSRWPRSWRAGRYPMWPSSYERGRDLLPALEGTAWIRPVS